MIFVLVRLGEVLAMRWVGRVAQPRAWLQPHTAATRQQHSTAAVPTGYRSLRSRLVAPRDGHVWRGSVPLVSAQAMRHEGKFDPAIFEAAPTTTPLQRN